MKLRHLLIAGALAAVLAAPALADLTYTQGAGTTIFDFVCFTTKHCSAHTPINSAGIEIMTTAAPGQVQIGDGTNQAKVTAASTAAAAADKGVVTNESPNSQLSTAMGATADAACGTDTGTCSAIALIKRGNQTATTTATAVQAAIPAGEAHIGETGSNQIKVQVAQTVTASAYSAGNALGGLMTVANAARVSGSAGAAGTGGILTGLQLNSKTIQSGVQVDVFIFDANPTGSTCTDKTAFVIAAADFDKVVGILTIPSTPANGAGWFGATTTGAVGIPSYFPVTYDLASSTSIYACAVVRAAITPAATTDISFKYNILRN